MSKITFYLLLLSLATLTILGTMIGFQALNDQKEFSDEKTIVVDEKEQTEMSVNLVGIHPGETMAYQINLKSNEGDFFNITMDFTKAGDDSLAKFIDVEIRLNGKKTRAAKLSEYLNGEQVAFSINYAGINKAEIEILYSMSLDVGDEAQNTSADFTILLSATR